MSKYSRYFSLAVLICLIASQSSLGAATQSTAPQLYSGIDSIGHSDDEMIFAQGGTVLCQKWEADGLLKRRVQLPSGQCQDQWVNPQSGQTVRSAPSPCNSAC